VAVVGQAIATAALPALSRLWAEGRREEMHRTLLRTLQAGLALAIIGAAAFFLLAGPLVRIIYQHGAFSAGDTVAVAGVLSLLSLAVPAWIIQQIAVRAFYARGDTWRPMLLGTGVALAVIPLYLRLGAAFGVRGLDAAGVIGMSVNAVATLLLARHLHGGPDLSCLLGTGVRAVIIAVVGAAVARLASTAGGAEGLVGALIELASSGLVFSVLVLAGVSVFGDDLMRGAFTRLLRRRQR